MGSDFDLSRQRVELVAAGVERERPGKVSVWVRLRAGEEEVTASTDGVPGREREARLGARAALAALRDLLPGAPEAELVSVASVQAPGSVAMLVVLHTPHHSADKLYGTAPDRGGTARTAAMATLDALNRLLAVAAGSEEGEERRREEGFTDDELEAAGPRESRDADEESEEDEHA